MKKIKLVVESAAGFSDSGGKITETERGYELFDDAGRLLAYCNSAQTLATYAFNCGAISITHDYDLRKAGERL